MKSLPVDNLGFVEIGGVGEMVYRAVRFPAYATEYDEVEKEEFIVPVFTFSHRPEYGADYELTGQALIAGLCNLYTDINDPESTTNIAMQIWEWCMNNMQPYNIDGLAAIIEEMDYTDIVFKDFLRREATFSVKQFLDDLCRLGQTFDYYQAIRYAISQKDVSLCRKLYYEGRICDNLAFLERYRNIEDDEEYLARLKADFEEHINNVLEFIPDFRMRLKKDRKKNIIRFGADVQSVFDICWYTFARMVADVAPPVDTDMDCMESTGSILSCLCCGNYFVRRSGRQLYCNDPNCQAERNKRKSRAYYARNKEI